ncbi:MAG: type II toxin-antitoxin system ParD family antitoxin [Pirellulales bacterium]
MAINISPDLEQIVHGIYASGRYATEADVISDSLHLLQQREQLRNDLRRGVEELDKGERIDADEVFGELRKRAATFDGRTQ